MTIIDLPVSKPSLARRIFDNRLVRFFALFIITIAAYAGAQILPAAALPRIAVENREMAAIVFEAVSAIGLLLIYWLCVRWMEHRPVSELSLRRAPLAIPAGALIGTGLFTITIAILSLMGVAHVGAFNSGQPLLAAINMAILSAIGEEIVFRGVVFRIFEEMFGTFIALLVSAGFFGLIHMGNHGATVVSGVAIALEAGLLLAVSYAVVRNLWLPIGLHFGWNFAESGIFGSVVSGKAFTGLFATTMTGPEVLTGGTFGPEASVVAVAVCAAAAAAILIIAVRRGEWWGLRFAINAK
jgi:membrane protease YdiL (CAAX protease family)